MLSGVPYRETRERASGWGDIIHDRNWVFFCNLSLHHFRFWDPVTGFSHKKKKKERQSDCTHSPPMTYPIFLQRFWPSCSLDKCLYVLLQCTTEICLWMCWTLCSWWILILGQVWHQLRSYWSCTMANGDKILILCLRSYCTEANQDHVVLL